MRASAPRNLPAEEEDFTTGRADGHDGSIVIWSETEAATTIRLYKCALVGGSGSRHQQHQGAFVQANCCR